MGIGTLSPESPQAQGIEHLFLFTLAVCAVIFTVVSGLVVYSSFHFRDKPGKREPQYSFGNKKLEIIWTAIPLAILLILFGSTWNTMRAVDPPPAAQPDVIVTARQWWWDVSYPKAGVVTANELHLPTNRDMSIRILTGDVIHDFWVPQLTRKMDAIPDLTNHIWIRAERPGVYQGECAEYCGAQHAWMRFRVISESVADFALWERAQAMPAAMPAGDEAARGGERFQQLTCANCHQIRGTAANGRVAPDLTHFGSRKMLAAERLVNTPENVSEWLRNPAAFKPGCKMPNLQLPDTDIQSLTAYLESLQ